MKVFVPFTGLQCGCYPSTMTDHSHVEIWIDGTRLDPTSWLYCNFLWAPATWQLKMGDIMVLVQSSQNDKKFCQKYLLCRKSAMYRKICTWNCNVLRDTCIRKWTPRESIRLFMMLNRLKKMYISQNSLWTHHAGKLLLVKSSKLVAVHCYAQHLTLWQMLAASNSTCTRLRVMIKVHYN